MNRTRTSRVRKALYFFMFFSIFVSFPSYCRAVCGCIPTITSMSTIPQGSCNNPDSRVYVLKWTYSDTDNNDVQYKYHVKIKERGEGGAIAYDSGEVTSSNTQLTIGNNVLDANKSYYWNVQIQDSSKYEHWSSWASSSEYGQYIYTTPWPRVQWQANCTSGSNCYLNNNITFTSIGTAHTPATYQWSGSVTGTASSVTKSFTSTGSKTINLNVTDSYGRTCGTSGSIVVTKPDTAPSVSSTDTVSQGSCDSPNNLNSTLKWSFYDADGDSQAYYRVVVKEEGTDVRVYDSGEVASSSKQITIGSDHLSPNKTYYWKVQVKDNHSPDSAWSSWVESADLIYAAPWPRVQWQANCTSGSNCYLNNNITFTSIGTAHAPATYQWSGSVTGTASSVTKSFTSTGSKTVNLNVTDSYGRTCGTSGSIAVTEAPVENAAPSVSSTSTASQASCDSPYNRNQILSWTFQDPDGDSQAYYRVVVKEEGTDERVYDSDEVASSSKQVTISSDHLSPNKTYYWKVRVKDNHASDSAWSSWVDGGWIYTTSWPVVQWSANCTSGSNCYLNSEVTFTSTGTAYSPSYKWYVDDMSNPTSVHNPSMTRLFTSGTSHTIKLGVTDGYGRTCSSSGVIALTQPPVETNTAPTVITDTVPQGSCDSPNNLNNTLKWSFYDADGDSQAYYRVVVKEEGTDVRVYDSGEVASSSKQITIGSDHLSPNKTYYWKVQAKDNHSSNSAWSSWVESADLIYATPWPVVNFTMNCTSGKDCYLYREITFTSTGTAQGSPSYNWYVDDMSNPTSVHNPSMTRLFTSGTSHTIKLGVTDGYGRTCSSSQQNVVLTEDPCYTSLRLSKTSKVHTGDTITANSGISGNTTNPISYYWKLNGNKYDPSNALSQERYTFSSPGSYGIGVYAKDATGKVCSEATANVSVTDIDQCAITSFSIDKDRVYYGDTISIRGSVSGNTVNPRYEWTVVNASSGQVVGSWTGNPPTSFTFPESENASITYNIKLRVTDDEGRVCNAADKVVMAVKRSPKWNETIPNLLPVQMTELLMKISTLHF